MRSSADVPLFLAVLQLVTLAVLIVFIGGALNWRSLWGKFLAIGAGLLMLPLTAYVVLVWLV
jgi:hypothetical protein